MELGILALLTASVSAVAAWRWRAAWRGAPLADRILPAAAVPALFCILALAASCIIQMLSDPWSPVRLAPSVAMTRGYALYYPAGEGPVLGWIYGPVMPLLQLPAALLPHPVAATLAAGILDQAILLLPLLLLAWTLLPPTPSGRATGVLILAALQALMLHLDPSIYWLQQIEADTFAIGLGLLSFVPLLGADPARPVAPRRLWLAAMLFAGAVFSKQNEICVLPVLLAFVGLRDGPRQALRLALATGAGAAAGLLLLAISCGWNAVILNLWRIPSGHPSAGGWDGFLWTARTYLEQLSGIGLLFLGLWIWSLRSFPRASTMRERLLSWPWALPAAAAVAMLPISVAGGAKIGGDDNSNHSLYYLVAAIGMLAARLATSDRPAARAGIPALAGLSILVGIPLLWLHLQPPTLEWRESRLEREYRFSRDHPGEVFLSTNPLITLYTDGKLYHQGYGVYDRALAGLAPPPRQLADHLPARMRWVGTPGSPFWVPDGGTPVPPPAGLSSLFWIEHPGKPR